MAERIKGLERTPRLAVNQDMVQNPLLQAKGLRDRLALELDQTLASLPDGWVMLRDRRIGSRTGAQVAVVLIHPEAGVALLDLADRDPIEAVPQLRSALTRRRFPERFPGILPIVPIALGEAAIPEIADRLADAFEAAPICSVTDARWCAALDEVLFDVPEPGRTPVAITRSPLRPSPPPRAPIPRLIAEDRVAARPSTSWLVAEDRATPILSGTADTRAGRAPGILGLGAIVAVIALVILGGSYLLRQPSVLEKLGLLHTHSVDARGAPATAMATPVTPVTSTAAAADSAAVPLSTTPMPVTTPTPAAPAAATAVPAPPTATAAVARPPAAAVAVAQPILPASQDAAPSIPAMHEPPPPIPAVTVAPTPIPPAPTPAVLVAPRPAVAPPQTDTAALETPRRAAPAEHPRIATRVARPARQNAVATLERPARRPIQRGAETDTTADDLPPIDATDLPAPSAPAPATAMAGASAPATSSAFAPSSPGGRSASGGGIGAPVSLLPPAQ